MKKELVVYGATECQNLLYMFLFKTLFLVTVVGIGFGFVMALVSNLFVYGVQILSKLEQPIPLTLKGFGLSFGPTASLLIAVFFILLIRRFFGITLARTSG